MPVSEYYRMKQMPVSELLKYVDRSNPQVRVLAERLELFKDQISILDVEVLDDSQKGE